MTGFSFDAKAALEAARKLRDHPNRPIRPNPCDARGAGLGAFGRLGTGWVPVFEISPEGLTRDLYEERAAALADPDGVARTPEAIEAVWDAAAAMARNHHHERNLT